MTHDNGTKTPAASENTYVEFAELLFSIRISTRYHRSRQRFWDGWSDIVKILSVVSGSAAFASVLAGLQKEYALSFTFIVAFLQAADLVLSPSKRARLHSDLARQFINLEQKSLDWEFDLNDRKVSELASMKLGIEVDEPPVKRWLLVHFNNELERAEHGTAARPYSIPAIQRLLMNYYDFFDVTNVKRVS